MTSTPDLTPLDGCDDPGSVLAWTRGRKQSEEQAAREVMIGAVKFAAMHSADTLVGPFDTWHERALPLGGEGCPEVTEFAVTEVAAALGMSPESGRRFLSHALEGHYRLTRCWKRVVDGQLAAWRLRMLAERTMCLSPAAAAFVDAHVAPVAHKIGPAQLTRLVDEAVARFDPEQTERDRATAAAGRHVDIDLAPVSTAGTVRVEGELDLADGLDLETAVAAGAREQAALGSTAPLDVRRAVALGDLARAQLALGFGAVDDSGATGPLPPRRPVRQVVLHAHVAAEAVTGFTPTSDTAGNVSRVEETLAALTVEQVRSWCGNDGTTVTVRPVLDLAEHIHVMSYEASGRLKLQTRLRDGTCVHPWCTRPAVTCDCEHRVPHDLADPDRGPTCTCNQAPTCRPHHRAKTTGGWSYVTVEPGVYLWRSPLGYQYLRDASGTVDVTPDDDRARYARELIAHFGDPSGTSPPET